MPAPRRIAAEESSEGSSEESTAHWRSAGGRPLQMQVLRAEDPLLEEKRTLLVALGADGDVDSGLEVETRPGSTYYGGTYYAGTYYAATYYGATVLRSTCGPARLRRGPRCCALARCVVSRCVVSRGVVSRGVVSRCVVRRGVVSDASLLSSLAYLLALTRLLALYSPYTRLILASYSPHTLLILAVVSSMRRRRRASPQRSPPIHKRRGRSCSALLARR